MTALGAADAPSALGALSAPHQWRAPLGTLRLLLHSVVLEQRAQQDCAVVIKCGPHWAQTKAGAFE